MIMMMIMMFSNYYYFRKLPTLVILFVVVVGCFNIHHNGYYFPAGVMASSSSSSSFSSSTTTTSLDFSYLHRVKSSILKDAIQQNILLLVNENNKKNENDENDDDTSSSSSIDINLDISSSMMNKNITDFITSLQQSYPSTKVTIQNLTCRANQWNINDATKLLESIIQTQCQQQQHHKNNPAGAGTGTGTGTGAGTTTSTTTTTTTTNPVESKEDMNSLEPSSSITTSEVDTTIVDTDEKNVTLTEVKVEVENESNVTTDATTTTAIESNLTQTKMESNQTTTVATTIDDDDSSSSAITTTTTATNNTTTTTTNINSTDEGKQSSSYNISIQSLDLGWNNLGQPQQLQHQDRSNDNDDDEYSSSRRRRRTSLQQRQSKAFFKSLTKLIENESCPQTLRFQVCGLGPGACRAIGKGIIARYQQQPQTETTMTTNPMKKTDDHDDDIPPPSPLSLYLTRNEAIGDAGTAALAAAIRTVSDAAASAKKKKNDDEGNNNNTDNDDDDDGESTIVLDVLDLSGCDIGDTGAEALAIALEKNPIKHLDLSNNQITDEGATVLGRALAKAAARNNNNGIKRQLSLDLSHNKDIGDAGAKAISEAMEKGALRNVVMRSCHIHADGAACFANAIKHLRRQVSSSDKNKAMLRIDLSGNPLGILRKKSKKGGGKYSATVLKSKATATTSAYMKLIGKTVNKGLKDLGITDNSPDTLESDDEEEANMNGENGGDDDDPSKMKCGALAFASAFIEDEDDDDHGDGHADKVEKKPTRRKKRSSSACQIDFGLRQCHFDTKAAEALAAVRQEAKNRYSMDLALDVRMNNVLEDEMIAALRGDPEYESDLVEMAERHMEAMEVLRQARQRSIDAARAAAARFKAEREMEAAWDAPPGFDDDEEEEWDSDADYDDPEDSGGYY